MQIIYTRLIKGLIVCALIFSLKTTLTAQPIISYGTPLVTGINNAVDVVNAGDSRLFIAQQNGVVRIWDGTTLSTFMDLSGQNLFPSPLGGEQGLLSIAFDPNFATNRYFFIWYTGTTGAVTLARYRANAGNPSTVDLSSGQVLLSVAKPGNPYYQNHNGGKLNFGPDGMLYIGLGDGGSGGDPFNNAQNGNSLLGKMLRLDVSGFATSAPFYTIPADNPFLTPGDGILDEIYALGLRNPWRWSFDRANGSMWIADVGQDVYEEVNYRAAGATSGINYGWRCREGMHNYNGGCGTQTFTEPIFEYDHTTGGQSITGGYVYRGTNPVNAPLVGYYMTTDFITGSVWLIQPNGNFVKQTAGTVTNIASFGEGADGALYAVRRATNGGLYRVTVSGALPVTISNFNGAYITDHTQLNWSTSTEVNTAKFVIEYSTNGNDYTPIGEQVASRNTNGGVYSFQHNQALAGVAYYRLKIVDDGGNYQYTNVLKINAAGTGLIKINPNMISNGTLSVYSAVSLTSIQVFSMDGKKLFEKQLTTQPGNTMVNLPALHTGVYIAVINGKGSTIKERIFIQ